MIKQLSAMFSKKYAAKWLVALMTAFGAFGGFPSPPQFLQGQFIQPVFQFLALWVLVMQGGGSMDPVFSFVVSAVVMGLLHLIKYMEAKKAEDALIG